MLNSLNVTMSNTAYLGLAVTSHNNTQLSTTTFDRVMIEQPKDIGSPGLAGSTTYNGTQYTVQGSGADIWGTSDQFQFSYTPVSGPTTVIARVNSLTNTNAWAKAGVMIRESLDPGAKNVFRDFAKQRSDFPKSINHWGNVGQCCWQRDSAILGEISAYWQPLYCVCFDGWNQLDVVQQRDDFHVIGYSICRAGCNVAR